MADQVTFDEAQQALVDKLVGEARVKARETAKAQHEADQVKVKEDSDAAALAANQEWQTLAEQYKARIAELEPLLPQMTEYQGLIDGWLKAKIKEMGDGAKKAIKALPGSMSAMEKLTWLNENTALFQPPGDGVGTPQVKKLGAQQTRPAQKVSKYPIRL